MTSLLTPAEGSRNDAASVARPWPSWSPSWRWLPAAGAGAIDIKEVTTPLGIKAWLVEDRSAPVVALVLFVRRRHGVRSRGPVGRDQSHGSTAHRRCRPTDAQAFRAQEDVAASLGFGASLDRLSGSMRVLSANRDEGFELLRLALTQPRFDPTGSSSAAPRRSRRSTRPNSGRTAVAQRTLMATLFAGHPYAADPEGRARRP